MKFESKIIKSGNSYSITIPANILHFYNIKDCDFLTISIFFKNNSYAEFSNYIRIYKSLSRIVIPKRTVEKYSLNLDDIMTFDLIRKE
jgi:hypothetical protein